METTGHALPESTSPRDAAILEARVRERSIRETAEEVGCSPATVKRVTARHREWVEEQRCLIQRHILENIREPVDARLQDAANPDSRTGAQSLRVLAESCLGWGSKTDIQFGDRYYDMQVDARSIVVPRDPAELTARLEQLEREAGLRD